MHKLYSRLLKRDKPDFIVKYEFKDPQRLELLPYQGYRCNYLYKEDVQELKETFMIFPEFLDPNGEVILETDKSVPYKGIAYMWIVLPEMVSFHKNRLKVGQIGYFVEGSRIVAECEVMKVNR